MWGFFQLLSISNTIKCSEPMNIITVWVGSLAGHLWSGLGPRLHLSPSFYSPTLNKVIKMVLHQDGFSGISVSSNPGSKSSWNVWVLHFLQCTVQCLLYGYFPLLQCRSLWRRIGAISTIYTFWVFVEFSARESSISLNYRILDLRTGSDLETGWGIIIFH